MFEEFGWRQYLLPQTTSVFNGNSNLDHTSVELLSAALIGVLWAVWHLPLFFPGPNPKKPAHALAAESNDLVPRRFASYVAAMVFVTIVMHKIYKGSGGSIWTAVIFHGSYNSSFAIFKIERVGSLFESVTIVAIIFSVAVYAIL